MRVLDRYIVAALCRHVALAMLVIAVLAAVFLFVNEQGWVGVGRYGQPQALRYVLAQLPGTALQFLPVAALLGTLLAVGELARGSELTVMRAAGVSVARIAAAVALAGCLLLPIAVLVGEWLAPPLAQAARIAKATERDGRLSLAQGSAWLRDGARLVRADAEGGITVFELDGTRLVSITTAARTRAAGAQSLQLADATRVKLADRGAERERLPRLELDTGHEAGLFELAAADPRQQSMATLWTSIDAREARGLDATPARFALWSAMARLVATPLAMLLAVPMLVGFLRSSGIGARASLGLGLGLAWFILQRLVENGTLAFGLDPLLLAWLPTLLLALAVGTLLERTRRI